ncbi:FecR domain-containing protein [Bradyrhizobium manausense]|nr:FecR domain-containing protein [Bradyrhizobium manausense]
MPDGAVVIADPNLIFHGEFKRTGVDLVLSHDGHEFVVHDYFRGDKRAAIASPDGAHLTGDIVSALTGYVQVAQAAPAAAAAQVIGHVTKLTGSATAIRNGVSVILNNGDNVEKGDVVSTGSDSTLGVTFIDGTVFGLSSNARMVLNEMVYDPNGSNNSSLLSLVAGTITFVAGDTAKHGDMKIDTPVATMGIRGTAVLTEINFVVPQGGGDPQPQANFQVLVEPNGTTGSYILFDKLTLLPIATVNQAGQMIQISGGNVSVTNALLSPDVQKLITDVFTLKFTDNNSNTKLTTNFTDTITQDGNNVLIKTAGGATATATFTNTVTNNGSGPGQGGPDKAAERIPGPPDARTLDANGNVTTAFATNEHAAATGDLADTTGAPVPPDMITFRVTFVDQNLGDRPTVSVSVDASNYTYQDAGHHDVTASLTALQKQDIAATQVQIGVAADGGNNNNGSAVLTYTVPDHAFDFLGAGETLTLTYNVSVDNNFAIQPETKTIPITITITGTNDKPVITTSVPTITFSGGTSVPGGPLISDESTSGTLNFADVDLTDTHTVAVALTSASLPDGSVVPPGPLAEFQKAMSVAIAAGADSTGDGSGTVNWSLADLPVYLADFIPKNEVLTLVYTVTVTDEHGATAQQTITVTITGTDAPAVVWIATEKDGAPSGGSWKDAANWATGTVPTIDDDVIVITDQLHGLTPSFPATIDAPAFAKSVTMNDFGGPPPQLINQSSLTIAGSLDMSADSIFTNAATGTMSLGGLAEILDTSVFTNAGYLTLKAGGDFAVGTTITNSGTLELFGGTLKTLAEIHNAGGTLKTDVDATLIVDGATIDGGTVAILGTLELDGTSLIENGTLNNSGAVNVKGTASFAAESVDNTSTGLIEVLANGSLTIHQGSSVTNAGHITVDASGKLIVNDATIGAGAVIGAGNGEGEGGPIFNAGLQSAGTITVNGEIDLTGDAVLSDGILNNNALFNASGTGNALSGETVTNAGTIEVLDGALAIDQGSTVDNSSGNVIIDGNAVLTLDDATIGGGAITGDGGIDVTGASTIDNGATLSVATVTVDAKLTLDGTTVSGSTITNNASIELDNTVQLKGGAKIQGGPVTNNGTLEIAGAATLLNDVVTNNGTVTVDGSQTLTLSGTEISGGTINGSGAIDVTGASRIDGGATLSTSAVTADAKLTLDGIAVSGSVITDNSSIELDNTVQLKGGAKIQGGPVTNNGTLEIAGAATLLNDVVTNNGTVTVDGSQTLTLSGTEISGGTINGSGAIDVTGASRIDGGATLSTSAVTAGAKLTLDGITVLGSVITDNSSIELDNTVQLKGGAKIQGGPVTNNGTLEIAGAATLLNDVVTNNGTVTVDGSQTLTLSGTEISGGTINGSGTIQVTGASRIDGGATLSTSAVTAGAKLTLDSITVSGSVITDNSSIELDNTVQLKGGAKIQGGPVTNNGTLEIAGAATLLNDVVTNSGTVTIDDSQTLTLSGTEISGGTINNYNGLSGGAIDVTGSSKLDGNATLNKGGVTVESGVTLTLDDATVAGTAITNHGTVKVDGSSKLTLSGASLTGGTLSVSGTLASSKATTITDANISNTYLIEAIGGVLALVATTSATAITNDGGTIQANGGELDINGEAVTNTGTLAAINNGQLKLISNIVTNTGGTVSVASGSTLDLSSATVKGGTLTIAGTLESVGTSAITGADITNTGTITVTSGKLTIDPDVLHTITNSHLIQANNGELDITGELIVNTADIMALGGGILKLTSLTVTNSGGMVTVDGTSKLYLSDVSINGGSLNNSGHLYGVSGSNNVAGAVTNTGTIEVQAGTLNLSGGLTGAGQLVIDDQATLELGGANAQTVTFAGGADTLKLDKTSHGFTGTITGQATTAGTFTVTGNANITTSQGDALDFTASGGSIGSRGDIVLTPTGTLSGANNGIAVTQNGIGNISLTTVGDVTGTAGDGIVLHDGATGAGDISATIGGAATGAVGLDVVAKGDGDVTITNNGHITGTASFGISVVKDGTGSTHITNTGSVVGAGGSAAISIHENTTGAATIDNSGTIGPDAASVTSTTSAIFETGGAIEINNTGHINGNISVASATFDNESSGTWTVSGTSVFGTLSTIDNAGEIDLLDGASISSADGLTFGIANSGKIESWGATSITGKIVNTNTIEIHTDGTLSLFGSLSGSGSVTIDAGATLYLDAIVSQTVTFAGAGAELEVDTASFGGSIAGFAANEKIDLSTVTWDSGTTAVYNSATGNLVVSDTHNHSITLKLIGDYSDAHFITSSDGNGGTTVELVPVDHWINSASGDWNTASNWSVGVPAASYDVKLDAPGSYTVDSTGSVTIQDLTVASGVTLLTEPGTVFTVKGEVVLNGLIEAGPFSGNDVSTIDIKGDITGTGAIEISNKAVVEIEGSVSGITVYYDNGLGNLILDESRDFHGLISGSPAGASLSSNNLIDLKDLAWTSTMSAQANYNADTNITTVGFYNGTTNVTLSFLGRDVNWHLQSDGHGGTTVYDPLAEAPMTIESGSVLNLSEASSQVVTFANGSGTTGTLAIQHAADFTGVVNGFAGDGTVANSDLLDLKDIGFSTLTGVSYSENADHLGGALTLSDGTDTAIIKFAGSYSIDSFHFVSDGNGGTLVVDPPTAPILVGTSGQDQFTFTNSTHSVQNTIVDFEVGQDKIDLHAFTDIKSFGDIVITQQASDALVTLDDHQSILLKKLVASSLHASDFILANHA